MQILFFQARCTFSVHSRSRQYLLAGDLLLVGISHYGLITTAQHASHCQHKLTAISVVSSKHLPQPLRLIGVKVCHHSNALIRVATERLIVHQHAVQSCRKADGHMNAFQQALGKYSAHCLVMLLPGGIQSLLGGQKTAPQLASLVTLLEQSCIGLVCTKLDQEDVHDLLQRLAHTIWAPVDVEDLAQWHCLINKGCHHVSQDSLFRLHTDEVCAGSLLLLWRSASK